MTHPVTPEPIGFGPVSIDVSTILAKRERSDRDRAILAAREKAVQDGTEAILASLNCLIPSCAIQARGPDAQAALNELAKQYYRIHAAMMEAAA